MNQVVDFINVNRDRYVDELKTYLAIPSISALPEHAGDVRRCAEWTRDELTRIGLQNARLEEAPVAPACRTCGPRRRRGVRPSMASGSARPAPRPCCSTGTTTCSPSIRSISGS